jgi:hypothetical protein
MNNINLLLAHPFVDRAMSEAIAVHLKLLPKGGRLDADYLRDPEEHEYYLIEVGRMLAHLTTCYEQMEHAVEFLSDFSYSKRMRERGIRRHHHLLYNVENYIIRTQALYDRLLQLVN